MNQRERHRDRDQELCEGQTRLRACDRTKVPGTEHHVRHSTQITSVSFHKCEERRGGRIGGPEGTFGGTLLCVKYWEVMQRLTDTKVYVSKLPTDPVDLLALLKAKLRHCLGSEVLADAVRVYPQRPGRGGVGRGSAPINPYFLPSRHHEHFFHWRESQCQRICGPISDSPPKRSQGKTRCMFAAEPDMTRFDTIVGDGDCEHTLTSDAKGEFWAP